MSVNIKASIGKTPIEKTKLLLRWKIIAEKKPNCGLASKASEMELINQTTFQTRHKYREPTHTASVVPEMFRGFLHPLIFVQQVHSANHDQTLQSLRKNIQFPYEAERSKATRQAACLYVYTAPRKTSRDHDL